jgi:spore coat polysaccharide biosynthesis protein SpsF (cytidylyltransferase family)
VSIDADDIIPSIEALHETVAALVSGQPLVKTRNLPIGMNVHGYTGATLENALKGIELEQFETGWMQIFDSFDIHNIAYADFDKFNVIRATIDYEDDFKFFERVLNEISNWNALSTFALCEEVISRKISLENTYLNDEYWEYHNKNKQQEKLIR